ncbi:Skp1-related protein [Caenorhabditis elegans]|uniref:Skp1-related protein n=1 Tax=Caenorhabditis elegans TaxID=6239 RepID=G5EDY3_CAEEL|nr:Skp1-related protein [Caenorhabditis elegans]AAL34097.1 SKR-7 [Caenorhabditis elegans]CCD69372.1 Skp1-related protein [Caenorhabditis elegans]|eukprot:NP_504221.1 SKp1 Related (ubiquitin ligase complex component) [Caenorhabditis elegans]
MSAEAAAVEVQANEAPIVAPIMYKVESSDGQVYEISDEAVKQSNTLSNLISTCVANDVASMDPIPITNVTGNIMKMVIEWCEKHKGETLPVEDDSVPKNITVPEWDTNFLKIDNDVLFDLIVASNFLDVPGLMSYACKMVANMAIGKSPDEMRVLFAIPTDEEDEAAEKAAKEKAEAEKKAITEKDAAEPSTSK